MVPNGWLKHKFYEIVKDTQLGTTERHKGDICNNPIPLLKMGNLTWGGFNLNSVELLPREKLDSTLLLKKGDFLFNTRNTPELVGKSAVWNSELPEAVFDNNINRITFKNGIDPFYIVAYLNNGRGKAIINSLPAGSTSVAAIYWKDLKNVQITIPPPPEQRKIAKILSTWDQAIATTERLITTSQQQKKALMQQLLTGKKRLVNPETGRVFEGDWGVTSLGSLAQKIGSGVTPKGGSESYKTSGIPLIRSQNVLWGKIDLSDVAYIDKKQHQKMKGSVVLRGDVLLNITGASIGRVAISDLHEANVNQHVCIIRSDVIHPEYLKNFLLSFRGQKQIEQFQAGGNRQGLNFEQIKSFKIFVCSLSEQQKIASVLTAAAQEIELLEAKLSHLKDEKKALMQQLLTGKRRVNVDAAEVA